MVVVFVTSFTLLFYEILLTRIFAIIQWQNLSSLIISLALLGFGASGTAIMLFKPKIDKFFDCFLFISLICYPIAICIGFALYSLISLNPFEIGLDSLQFFYLVLYGMAMGVPFFFGAAVIGLMLLRFQISKVYFFNLLGSGIGAMAIILASDYLHPYYMLVGIVMISFFVAVMFSVKSGRNVVLVTLILAIVSVSSLFLIENVQKISPYKAISGALNLPESKVLNEKYSPLGLIQVVEAEGLRSTVGLSLISPYAVPVQKGIFFDGEAMSPITPYKGDKEAIRYLNHIPSVLPYMLLEDSEKEKVLIVGVGGGEDVLKALLYDFKEIHGLELNSKVISLMKNEYADFSGNIYNLPQVRIINKEARGYIRTSKQKYNLIELSMLDSFNSAASGVYALNETYLYTSEAIRDFLLRLEDNGLLSLTRWVLYPPRDSIKLLNICIDALKKLKVKDIHRHIIYIRSIQSATLIISKTPLPSKKIERTIDFCDSRLFDLIYYDGISQNQVNRFIKLDSPFYYLAASNLLSPEAPDFVRKYDFDISVATDNGPYFYNFFKLKMLRHLEKLPVTEWGYFVLLLLLIPVVVISFILILFPLFIVNKHLYPSDVSIISYFGLIGTGFFFIEIPLIQKLILFLAHPTYSLSVIISGLLVFSGIGSYFSDKIFKEEKRILSATLIIVAILILYMISFDFIFSVFMNKIDLIKILVVMFLLFPLGFFMGVPFPQGLTRIKKIDPAKVVWAWGINGFFSVVSIIMAALLGILWGFNAVFLIAGLCYLIAGIISLKL